MNVLRHHHIANHPEPVLLPHFIQNPQERVTPPPRPQQRPPPVTTARNKVQLPPPIPPLQFVTLPPCHSCAPSPAARVRHPELQKQQQTQKPINFNVNYHSGIITFTMVKQYHAKQRSMMPRQRVGHPPTVLYG